MQKSGQGASVSASSAQAEPLMRGYLPHYLSRLMNMLNLQLMETLRPLDMTTQQYRVMQVLFIKKVASIGDISQDAVVERSVVSRIIDQLEKREFVRRQKRADNARIVEVSLTGVGKAVYQSIMPSAQAITQDAMSALSEEESLQLNQLLARVFVRVGRSRVRQPKIGKQQMGRRSKAG
jgi:DNA-binding MarR family transcriptional regulator